jgi:hypothetical protein
MTQATARTAVYNAVNGVTGKGVAYDYERWAVTWPEFLDLFRTTVSGVSQIRGWEVCYRGFSAVTPPRTFGKARQRRHRFLVQGYMGLEDAAESEKTFAALAESVANAIDGDATLQGSAFLETGDAEIATLEPRLFGGTLCHYAEINVTVSEMYDA